MKYLKHLILVCVFALPGCLSPVKTESTDTYVLNTIPCNVPKKATRPITILVLQPETRPIYNTTQMAYTVKPFQVSFFAKNQWAETPSQMFLPLIVQTLQNTHAFHAVVTPPYTGRYSYLLTTQILQLQQNFLRCPDTVEVGLRAQITRASTNQIVASKQFSVSVPIQHKTPYSGVIAANKATAIVLAELANFTLQHT